MQRFARTLATAISLVAGMMASAPAARAHQEEPGEFASSGTERLLDARTTWSGEPGQKVKAGGVVSVNQAVVGRYWPEDAKALSLNVTITQPARAGFATVYLCRGGNIFDQRPLASSLNFVAGQTVANAVQVEFEYPAAPCVYVSTSAHVIVDYAGFFPTTGTFEAIVPTRAADTRDGAGGAASGKIPAGQTLAVPLAGRHGLPANASSVAAIVTVTEPGASGYVTVWPCGTPRPLASNLNFAKGQTVPNSVISGVGSNGSICLYTTAITHLVVDVGGAFTGSPYWRPQVPERVFDTRKDGDRMKLNAGEEIAVQFGDRGDQLDAVVLNVTVTQPERSGYVSVYPCNHGERPRSSSLNFVRGQTVPNMVIAQVSSGPGLVCFYSSARTHLLADISGEFHRRIL